ncbi:glycosyltransferase family 2 protein [Dysgonomonas sp. 511]|uniref:glycosyltransferase family 2 protein n=1 Tax=Dysgonomonas sp. 511 TaxID=2302930 RepID=UPI0013D4D869|nr:glycosyltransferase family 2 protein [Dysgonomonas sp. 511]NDV78520.1 glycosyltransferase [Dysgonomonas sp. 511]
MKPYPTVTLIVSTYNWPQALDVCLKSIAHQKILPTEVVVADDGSKQDTTDLINKVREGFPCPLIHVWHEDTGFRLAAIRNKAIAKATGDYIIQIDGDIVLEKHFVQDHLDFSRKGCFVSGSRVKMDDDLSATVLSGKKTDISIFTKGIINHLNGLRVSFLRNYYRFRYRTDDPYYVKGCNMAFWREDLIAVNGYNEDMTGWGREDSEVAARLINLGDRRQFIKFGAVEYHIEHPFSSREREPVNLAILEDAIANKVVRCKNGLDKYMESDN